MLIYFILFMLKTVVNVLLNIVVENYVMSRNHLYEIEVVTSYVSIFLINFILAE